MIDSLAALVRQIESGDIVLVLALLLLVSAGLCLPARRLWLTGWRRHTDTYRQFAWQLGALLGLEQAYEFTRGRIAPSPDVAILNSYRLLDLEWRHGLFVEQRLERFFLQFGGLMNAVDLFYVFGHLLVTLGVLVWIYLWKRPHYPFVRNLIMLTTGIALVSFYVFPAAPPRMLGNYGFVDPLQLHHLVGAGGAQPGSYTYNPYAAMPSLHVGYALVVAWGAFVAERRLWVRAAAVLYPMLMAATVVISGNHWILDVIGAVATVALSGAVLLLLSWLGRTLAAREPKVPALTEAPVP